MLFSLWDVVEVIRIDAQIDEAVLARSVCPWYDEDDILDRTFDGPLGKHRSIIAGEWMRDQSCYRLA
jgi:hypothetical protein